MKNKFLSESQISWFKIQKIIITAEPNFILNNTPKSLLRNRIYHFYNNYIVVRGTYFFIILDIIILSLSYKDSDIKYKFLCDLFHTILNFLFFFETLGKFYANGYTRFLYTIWGKLELFIFITIILDIIEIIFLDKNLKNMSYFTPIIKGLRAVKMLRLLRLIKKIKNIETLLTTLKLSVPMMFNIFSLLVLIYYIFALVGCYFFKDITTGTTIDEYINFKNFSYGFMTLYKVSTADGWEGIMFDISQKYCKYFFLDIILLF